MNTIEEIKDGSQWLNNKTGDRYMVITVLNDLSGDRFVIYQLSNKEPPTPFKIAVKHSENCLIGECMLFPVEDGLEGIVDFETDLSGLGLTEDDLPWCRPLEMWHEKFTAIAGEELKTV